MHAKRFAISIAAIAVWFPIGANAVAADATQALSVVTGGQSAYVIVVPDDADAGRIAKASGLLQRVIAEATGVRLPVVKESALTAGTPAIYLGKCEAARRAGLDIDKAQGWAYLHRVAGRDIFLVGDDGKYPVEGGAPIEHLGTLKAVTAFLEDQVGVRFYMPGRHGTYVPKLQTLTVDGALDKSWAPLFDYVIGRSPGDETVGVALNLFGRTPVPRTYGGHSYYDAVPAKEYGETNPEYFIMTGPDGTRDPRGNHLCIANADVQELMLKEMERELDKGFEWIELAQTDGYQPCHCEACVAIHPEPGERTWIAHRKLAQAMTKRRPGKKVMIISYGPTVTPPKTFHSFPDNVVIQMCAYTPNAFADWAPYNVDKSVYIYNWGHYKTPGYAPKRTPRYAVEQVRLFRENRVRGIYICGGYRGGQGSYGIEGPSYYAYGKALEDPGVDPEALLDEYANAAFGKAAVPMRAFFTAMHNRLELYSAFDRPNTPIVPVPTPFRTQEDFFCHFFPAKLVNDMARNLDRARAMADDERVKANLRLVEVEFEYVRNMATVWQLYRTYRIDPNRQALELLAGKVEERRRTIDALFPGGKPTRIPGLPSPFMGAAKNLVEMNGRTLGAPLNWDFAFLLEKGVLPGTGSKSADALRAGKIVLDGRLDEAAWQAGPFEEMSEIGMGALTNATRFKVRYDDRHVYLGFVCDFDRTEPLEVLRPFGRDGAAYYQECVEVMIDPFGEREKHCQFVFNPIPNSTYDARYDYIEDPLHPLYGKRDSSWNGEWDYVAVIDRERKQWTAELRIPFSTLEVPAPQAGTVWTMNVGRTQYPTGYKSNPNYSIWSPNLEARSYHDRSTYGDVNFK